MSLPEAFIKRIQNQIPDWERFVKSLETSAPVSVRLNPHKPVGCLEVAERVPWCNTGYYLHQRPIFTLDPLFHAGTYYVQEASSMFIEQVVRQYIDRPVRTLDLCAAPGGKTTHLLSLLPGGSLLVSNEFIRSRAHILAENVSKWGYPSVVVTNNAPKDFSHYESFFDLIVVDAPCSGEGMFRKDSGAVEEWSEYNVQQCELRQRQIISDVWGSLSENGVCIYSTCTYNPNEDEEMVKWIEQELGAEELLVPVDERWGIVRSERGYHFYPHMSKGEGFYLCVLRKTSLSPIGRQRARHKITLNSTKNQKEIMSHYLVPHDWHLAFLGERMVALSSDYVEWMLDMMQNLKVMQAGVPLGRWIGKNFLPDPSLALSVCLKDNSTEVFDVNKETALSFLHKDAITLPPDMEKGMVLIRYKGHGLGWVKNLGNRCNSLFPDEWRIRMRIDK